MTTVSTLSDTSTSSLSATSVSAISELSENYDMFITLLTTQMQNQNPLDPTDTDELTSQLIQYSQVEQQILANQYLENLVLATSNQTAETALSFIGKEITYDGSSQTYEGEDLTWAFDVPDDVQSVTLSITNEDGLEVYLEEVDADENTTQTFTWDGVTNSSGTADEDTAYTLTVTANYADGTTEELDLEGTSVATQADWSTGTVQLILANGATIGLDDIISATAVS